MKVYFLDTSFLVALEDRSDLMHTTARSVWSALAQQPLKIVTSTYVINETLTYFNIARMHSTAMRIVEALRSSPSVELVHVDEELFEESLKYLALHTDKEVSFTDVTSFLICRKKGIYQVLSFDNKFEHAGFMLHTLT